MKISSVEFITSSKSINECPKRTQIPEYAFIGRSNVGKSSLINFLTNSKIAKTSSTPGKTQLINHYLINKNWFLVDLPGYGYAKTSKKNRTDFDVFTKKYLLNRVNLLCVFVLIDIRVEPQKNDILFINWLGENEIPFIRIFSKSDKQKKNNIDNIIKKHRDSLMERWAKEPDYIISSSKKKIGKELILERINNMNSLMK
tara:strand:+ start:121 stop:720 length:600 start_codon:yes stop_codon:yes gene_type:complete